MVPIVVSADVPFAEWIVRFDRLGTAYRPPLAVRRASRAHRAIGA
jgi:hypothetical protein